MYIDYYYYTLLQIHFIRATHIALHTLYFREIIYLSLYLPCFFLCLQFKQKIGPQPQLPAPDDDDDDDDDDDNDDDEDDTSLPSSTRETAPPTASSSIAAAAAVPSTFTAGVSKSSKKNGRTPGGDQDIVQLLLQHQERSQAAAGEL